MTTLAIYGCQYPIDARYLLETQTISSTTVNGTTTSSVIIKNPAGALISNTTTVVTVANDLKGNYLSTTTYIYINNDLNTTIVVVPVPNGLKTTNTYAADKSAVILTETSWVNKDNSTTTVIRTDYQSTY